MAAGIYAGRKKLKTLLATDSFGGQPILAGVVENFVGIKSIPGLELVKKIEDHLRSENSIELKEGFKAIKFEKKENGFVVTSAKGESFEAKTVLITLGSRYRHLNVPGEDKFEGKGVFYCSTCDAPLMKDKTVAVVGGGNAGFGAAMDLLPYASKIYILEYADVLRADPITQDKIKNSSKAEIITMAAVEEISGDEFVKGLKYQDRRTNEKKELAISGVFISIGYEPNSILVKGLAEINKTGGIVVDHMTQKTSCDGVWAAGDVTEGLYHQNNIAIADGIKAVLNINDYLKGK